MNIPLLAMARAALQFRSHNPHMGGDPLKCNYEVVAYLFQFYLNSCNYIGSG